jgi:hypothetical protein
MAYLMAHHNLSLAQVMLPTLSTTAPQALAHLKAVRPWVNPNRGFLLQLAAWREGR